MYMKIEIITLKISLPQKSFKSPEQTQHHGNNPNPSRKNLNTSESISCTPPKKLNPSRKNLNFPEKLPLPKNSITISETIYQTLELNLNPFPKNPNPL